MLFQLAKTNKIVKGLEVLNYKKANVLIIKKVNFQFTLILLD